MANEPRADIDQMRVDETYWPPGSTERVRRFLSEEYDPQTMPPLLASRRPDGFVYVLGWDNEGTGYPSLFEHILGRPMSDEELRRADEAGAA